MRLKYLLITFGLMFGVNAMAADTSEYAGHVMLWLVIVAIAFIALAISVVNAFRISKIRKVLEANYENTKEDMDLSFRKMKSSLYRDVKNIRREINKKRENNSPHKKDVKTEGEENADAEKKPAKKKPQHRRYNPNKKKTQNPQNDNKPTE